MKKVLMSLVAVSLSILANTALADNASVACAPSTSQNKLKHVIKWYRDSAEKKLCIDRFTTRGQFISANG